MKLPAKMFEVLLDKVLFGVLHDIEAANAGAVCLEIPGRPLHFMRLQRPDDFEIDKDVVYRAFTSDAQAACNADQTVWAVPIEGRERRLGVAYVKIDPTVKMKEDLVEALKRAHSPFSRSIPTVLRPDQKQKTK
jgi:hypothetical protein